MNWRLSFLAACGLAIALAAASVVLLQDNIARFLINPRTPFQTTSPPPAPEYGARGAWVLWPSQDSERLADVFYIHSTTYYSGKRWNGPLQDEQSDKILREIAAPNEAGPFLAIGNVYGPRYRQATLYAFFTHKYDGIAARKFAYRDVRSAFEEFLGATDPEKPLIIVGYEQGGLHALGILKDYFKGADNPLTKRLVAAYIIDHATPDGGFAGASPLPVPACDDSNAYRCIVSYTAFESRFDEEMHRARTRSMYWTDDGELTANADIAHLCANPLDWSVSETYVSKESHKGAASATGLRIGSTPPAVSRAIGARCDNGVLIVDKPNQSYLRRASWFGAKWRARPYNLFYFDLAENAAERVAALEARREYEAQFLGPIETSVDLGDSPVNKVPNR